MWNQKFGSIKLERAVTVPSTSQNPYGAIEAAFITLSGAQMIRVDVPPPTRDSKPESEPLHVSGYQIGLWYRDTIDDSIGAKRAFLLALQDEPRLPLERNLYQTQQDGRMIDLVMGILLVPDLNHTDTYKRIGLARWVDKGLFARSKSQSIKLV